MKCDICGDVCRCEKPTPQVGDVWEYSKAKVTIDFVARTNLSFHYDDNSIDVAFLDDFEEVSKIIERNGKPYKPKRVFEDGAYYPVSTKYYANIIVQFISGTFHGRIHGYEENKLTWIGEKIPDTLWKGAE